MNDKTAGSQGLRRARALAVAVAVTALATALATACSVQTSTSYPAGPAGSATYRQEVAFIQCLRSHGVQNLTDPPPGGGITLQAPQNGAVATPGDPWPPQAVAACRHLLPHGREITNIRIGLG
jgi:hypothetical protein